MSGHTWTVNPVGVKELCDSEEMVTGIIEPFAKKLAERINDTTPNIVDTKGSWTAKGRQVTTSSSFWHLAEYGARYSPPYAPVRASMVALGFTGIDLNPGAGTG